MNDGKNMYQDIHTYIVHMLTQVLQEIAENSFSSSVLWPGHL